MAHVSNPIPVSNSPFVDYIFNPVAGAVSNLSDCIPASLRGGLTHLFENLKSGPQKTFGIKSVAFLKDIFRHYQIKISDNPNLTALVALSERAAVARSFISALEALAYLPAALQDLSKKIEVKQSIRSYVVRQASRQGPTNLEIKEDILLDSNEILAKRIFNVAFWVISLGDALHEIKTVVEMSKGSFPDRISKIVPWTQVIAGTFMSTWGLYEECKFAANTWLENEDVHSAEVGYSLANLVANTCYLAYSILGGLGLYLGSQAPTGLGRAKFYVTALVLVAPIVVRWMEDNKNRLLTQIHKYEFEQLKAGRP